MDPIPPDWPRDLESAVIAQERLRRLVELTDSVGEVRFIGGVDCGYNAAEETMRAAVAVVSAATLELAAVGRAETPVPFPYIPGYLSFREVPAVLAALARLERRPDLLVCDGQGIAHPRRLGLACHVGLASGLPSIGCAKSRLVGKAREPGPDRGDAAPLFIGREHVGWVVRTRTGVKPVFVSPGHRVSVDAALAWVLKLAPRYRLTEPVRQAHKAATWSRHALLDE